MSLSERIRSAGVVGAGGAGFPTHVKMASQADWLLANGAECEPLLHKDRELLRHYAPQVLEGIRLAGASVGVRRSTWPSLGISTLRVMSSRSSIPSRAG